MQLERLEVIPCADIDAARLMAGSRSVALIWPPGILGSQADALARARRIAAAVNAADGIPTEALEAFAAHDVLRRYWTTEWELAFNAGLENGGIGHA